ncbi:MAG: hypothetical protein KA080_00340 [Leptotrichiaceae bacterium]|nr:hypothetical protein [Leptotrichiaceae bacterium]MBP9629690.1 hypothetical protein [Leptotrichiaceae bacterium]
MDVYQQVIEKIKKEYKSIPIFADELDMSKQLLYYHLWNLKKGKISFKKDKLIEISKKLKIDIFLDVRYTK